MKKIYLRNEIGYNLKYKNNKTYEAFEYYKQTRNEATRLIRRINENYLERFTKQIESDFYSR